MLSKRAFSLALPLALIFGVALVAGCIGQTAQTTGNATPADRPVKEFEMLSFYEIVDGKPKPQFSLSEMVVNKGDLVKVKITNTRGTHDFVIDELKVYAETPLNQTVVVEFVADKAGEFVYYCAKMNHREAGQWGTLKVLD
jgi:plastocyanin